MENKGRMPIFESMDPLVIILSSFLLAALVAVSVLLHRVFRLSSEKAALESRLDVREEYDREMKENLQRHREEEERRLRMEREMFENMARRSNEDFRLQSAQSIETLLRPLQEKFGEFSQAVRESQEKSLQRHAQLEQRIVDLDNRSRAVGDQAQNLADALTGYSKVQGDFGEMLLTDVLKNAGLTEGIHFSTQSVVTDEKGRQLRGASGEVLIPDVLVYYPDDTTVVIDSKVSLKDYHQFMVSENAAARKAAARAHVESIRRHVDELKDKDYAGLIPPGRRRVDFNIMFIPMEGAFRLMLEEDPRLWQVARENKVLIVSQMTLIIVLNMIQMSWRQYDQEKNIADVYKTAEELMTQIKGWMDSYVAVGQYLGKAGEAYREATRKLSESNQSVVRKIEKLEKLGLRPRRPGGKIRTSGRLHGDVSVIPREVDSAGDKENM